MGLFDGKVAIVTGAGRGIGRAEALLLASEGAAVVVNDLGGSSEGTGSDATPAQQVVDEIEAAGGRRWPTTRSVASFADAKSLVDQAVDTFGGLDVLINNAGILRDKMSFNMAEDEWDVVVERPHEGSLLHVETSPAAYWRAKAKETGEPARRRDRQHRERVRASTATPARSTTRRRRPASPSMTIVMARELERSGVRVNCIAPVARTG